MGLDTFKTIPMVFVFALGMSACGRASLTPRLGANENPRTPSGPVLEIPLNTNSGSKSSSPVEKRNDPIVTATPLPVPEDVKKEDLFFAGEIAEVGKITPTIYNFAIVDDDKKVCKKTDKTDLAGTGGAVYMQVCKHTVAVCGEEGSCTIIKGGEAYAVNVTQKVRGQDLFYDISRGGCQYGYGVKDICLDPFYTVAADLSIYKPGDVIYVPGVLGLKLPNGQKHDGFFIVRDRGRGIKGRGRFDFFSGYYPWSHGQNPLNKMGLSDVGTRIPYYKVVGPRAALIRKSRGYPNLPMDSISASPIKLPGLSKLPSAYYPVPGTPKVEVLPLPDLSTPAPAPVEVTVVTPPPDAAKETSGGDPVPFFIPLQ